MLPPDQFPQFAAQPRFRIHRASPARSTAIEGEFAAVADHADDGYMRLGRTFDLTAIDAAEQPTFEAQIAWSTEEGYDHVIVEAHTVGQDDWTTLPGPRTAATHTGVPAECEAGFYIGEHPQPRRTT